LAITLDAETTHTRDNLDIETTIKKVALATTFDAETKNIAVVTTLNDETTRTPITTTRTPNTTDVSNDCLSAEIRDKTVTLVNSVNAETTVKTISMATSMDADISNTTVALVSTLDAETTNTIFALHSTLDAKTSIKPFALATTLVAEITTTLHTETSNKTGGSANLITKKSTIAQPSASELESKIETLSLMASSVNNVATKINQVLSFSERKTRSTEDLSCSQFVELVAKFTEIASDASLADNSIKIASTLTESSVEMCTNEEIDKLQTLDESLSDISSQLQSKMETLNEELQSLMEILQSKETEKTIFTPQTIIDTRNPPNTLIKSQAWSEKKSSTMKISLTTETNVTDNITEAGTLFFRNF
jgi:hypothetical protein